MTNILYLLDNISTYQSIIMKSNHDGAGQDPRDHLAQSLHFSHKETDPDKSPSQAVQHINSRNSSAAQAVTHFTASRCHLLRLSFFYDSIVYIL